MIRAGDLKGRPVVDVDGAEKIGVLHEVILDPAALRVAGLAVSGGVTFIGAQKQMLLPSSAVHAIGPDAVMVHRPASSHAQPTYLTSLPRVSDLAGRRFISNTGRFIGQLADVLFDGTDGRIIGYEFRRPNGAGGIDALLGVGKDRPLHYVRAEDDLRFGHDLIVVPDDSVVDGAGAPASEGADTVTANWLDVGSEDGQTREFVFQEHRKAS